MALSLFSFPAFTAIYIKVYMEIIDLDLSCIPLQWASVTKWGRSSGGQFDINHCILSSLRSRRLKVVGEKRERARVSLARALSLFRPLLPSAWYAGYILSPQASSWCLCLQKFEKGLSVQEVFLYEKLPHRSYGISSHQSPRKRFEIGVGTFNDVVRNPR